VGSVWSLSIQVLATRANGPPGQQRDEDGTLRTRDIHTSTAIRKTDDRVLGATVEEMRAALGPVDADEANVLGVCRLLVAVEDLPTSGGGYVTQNVGRKSILVKL
jgi:hypothetical protein